MPARIIQRNKTPMKKVKVDSVTIDVKRRGDSRSHRRQAAMAGDRDIVEPGHRDLVADYVLDKARRVEQDAIDPPFERSLDLLPKLSAGGIQEAIAWLHTSPEDEAKRKAALEARAVIPAKAGIQSPKEKP